MALTPLFNTGFEHGFSGTAANMILGGGLASAQVGTSSIVAGSARTGSYGFHIANAGNTSQYIRESFTANNHIVTRIAVFLTAAPVTGESANLFSLQGTDNVFMSVVNTSGVYTLSCAIASGTAQTATVSLNTWYYVELQVNTSITTWTCDWKVNGVAQTQATFAEGATGTLNLIELGTHATNQGAYTCEYDDLIVGTWATAATDWWGDGGSIGQLAGSDGTHVTVGDFRPGDAGTAYSGTVTTASTMVDDAPASGAWTTTRSTTDSIGMGTNASTAYMEILPATTAHTGSANAVRALISYSSSSTLGNLAGTGIVNSAGTQVDIWGTRGGTGANYSVSANNFKGAMATAPVAGWTATEVNALKFRFGGCTSGDVSPVPTVQGMMLEVDWPAAVNATVLAVPALSVGNAPVPTVVAIQNRTIVAVPAQAVASAPSPGVTVSIDITITAVPALGVTVAPVAVLVNARAPPSAGAISVAPAPTVVAVQNATLSAVAASATSAAPVSTVVAIRNVTITAVTASASSTAPVSTVTAIQNVTITAVAASALGAASSPTIVGASGLTALYCTGYEHGFNGTAANLILGAGLASAQGGTPTVTSGAARNGGYGLHVPAPGNAACFVRHAFTGTKQLVFRFAMRVTVLPAIGDVSTIMQVAGFDNIYLQVDNAGHALTTISGGSTITGSTIGDGSWHVIEMQANTSGATWTVDWKVDGVLQTQATYVEGTGGNLTTIEFGTHTTNQDAFTADFDDLMVGIWSNTSTDWWGDGYSVAMAPGSDGTHTYTSTHATEGDATATYVTSATTDAYTKVNSLPWVNARSTTADIALHSSAAEYIELAPATSSRPGSANAIRALESYSSPALTAVQAGCIVRNSEGFAVALNGDLPTAQGGGNGATAPYNYTSNNFAGVIVPAPVAGWTATEINAVRWRFGANDSNTYVSTLQGLLLEVDWPILHATITAVAASVVATAPTITVLIVTNATVIAVSASGFAGASTPGIEIDVARAPPSAGGVATAPVPTIVAVQNRTVSATEASASAVASAPTVLATQNVTIVGVSAQGIAGAPVSGITSTQNCTVAAVSARSTSTAPVSTILATQNPTIAAVSAGATTAAPVPTVSATQNVTITAVSASGSAGSPSPTVASTQNSTITAVAASAISTAPPVFIGTVINLDVDPANATADGVAPTTSASTDVPNASATASSLADASVDSAQPSSDASASATAPTTSEASSAPQGAATASSSASSTSASAVPNGNATATAYPPTITIVSTETNIDVNAAIATATTSASSTLKSYPPLAAAQGTAYPPTIEIIKTATSIDVNAATAQATARSSTRRSSDAPWAQAQAVLYASDHIEAMVPSAMAQADGWIPSFGAIRSPLVIPGGDISRNVVGHIAENRGFRTRVEPLGSLGRAVTGYIERSRA